MVSMRDTVSDMTDRAGDYTGRARSGLSTLVTEQPWVLGALGLLVGAALAAILPRSQIEQDFVGSAAQHVRDQASHMACETYERLGSPEGELALAQAVLYLAVAPKSNAAYTAYNAARALIRDDGSRPVPAHLRNAPTKLMKEMGHGRDYRYAHDEAGGYAAGENYFPDGMKPPVLYRPTEFGLEQKIRAKLAELHELDERARRRK